MVNKNDLARTYAKVNGVTIKEAEDTISKVFNVMRTAIVNDGGIKVVGAFTLKVKQREARTGVNPTTKQPVNVPAKKVVKFTIGATLDNALNG